MAERISLMTPDMADCPGFTVNIGVNSVPVIPSVAPWVTLKDGGQAIFNWARGDSFMILSAGYIIPERFCIYQYQANVSHDFPCPVMTLSAYRPATADRIFLTQIGGNSYLRLPLPNYETCLGIWVDAEDTIGAAFRLEMIFPFDPLVTPFHISMVGVSGLVDGLTFKIVPFVKVMHNFALTV